MILDDLLLIDGIERALGPVRSPPVSCGRNSGEDRCGS